MRRCYGFRRDEESGGAYEFSGPGIPDFLNRVVLPNGAVDADIVCRMLEDAFEAGRRHKETEIRRSILGNRDS